MNSAKKKLIIRIIIVFLGLALIIFGCIAAINSFFNQNSAEIEKSKIAGGEDHGLTLISKKTYQLILQ